MTSIPPGLAYITIFNPTLKPQGTPSDDDEDAEEQAHILFYTSKERAVSRDRMLRQVGLAKALINFSEMFNSDEAVSSIHSQSRRMVMLSPEPDFWIHACVEVAKSIKQPPKGKGKEKEKLKGQEVQNDPSLQYDYDDSSVHYVALRSDLQRGYERFKLTHGSLASILANLGREALELQLERFWTVWAWSWDLEVGYEFGRHLGVPLHPLFRHIQPVLDELPQAVPDGVDSIAIIPPYVIPSNKFMTSAYPSPLASHLLDTMSPLHARKSDSDKSMSSSNDTLRPKAQPESSQPKSDTSPNKTHSRNNSNTFLGMPAVNMGVRKWNWPGYLTFGKSSNSRRSLDIPKPESGTSSDSEKSRAATPAPDATPQSETEHDATGAQADSSTVQSATELSTDEAVAGVTQANGSAIPEQAPPSPEDADPDHLESEGDLSLSTITLKASSSEYKPPSQPPSRAPSPDPAPTISLLHVHLPSPHDHLATIRQPVFTFTDVRCGASIALIGLKYPPDLSSPELRDLALALRPLYTRIQDVLEDELLRSAVDLLPSATKILQPKDIHIFSSRGFTISSPGFSSKSGHLFDAQSLQESALDITEVFSRGQNPQHWHVSRKGVGMGMGNTGSAADGEVYLEVFRKEASLTDVDNALAGIVKKLVD